MTSALLAALCSRFACLVQLLGSTVTDWSSAELAAIVESPQSLAEHSGLFVRGSADYNLRRQTLVLLIESICTATSTSFRPVFRAFLSFTPPHIFLAFLSFTPPRTRRVLCST